MQAHFLLVENVREHYWYQLLEEALAPLGSLNIVSEEEMDLLPLKRNYDVIIADATTANDVPLLVTCLRARFPEAKIVVVSASPTWQRARQAFLAGATEYIRKSSNKEETLSTFKTILERPRTSKQDSD